jgi:glycosyltransferase involved in cell wall biosynthesis
MNIVYTGLFAYPDSSANSLRVKGVVNLLESYGHNVTILPGLKSKIDINKIGSTEVVPVDEYSSGFLSGINGVRGMFIGDNTLDYLEKMIKKPDVIILYGTALGYLLRLLRFTKKYNIKLILDVVEWYDPRHLPGGLFGPYAIANELSMRFFVKKANGLIVISEYLRKYYEVSNKKIFLLPPLFQKSTNINFNKHRNEVLHLCYVGTPGKKENFVVLCDALELAYKNKIKFYIHFVGFNKDFIITDKYTFMNDESVCNFYGRLNNSEAKEIVAMSHYSIFFRPNLRFSNAGFPSKLAESFSLGTSVITNDFSDIKKYIETNKNGYIVEGIVDSLKIYELICRLVCDIPKYSLLQKNVLESYENHFSLNSHQTFKNYIDKI